MEHHDEPRTITLDDFEPSHSALRRMGMNPVTIRSCQHLNNVVEQDHRRVKFRLQPMLGFERFYNARRVIAGIELTHKIYKGQFEIQRHLETALHQPGVERWQPSRKAQTKGPLRIRETIIALHFLSAPGPVSGGSGAGRITALTEFLSAPHPNESSSPGMS